MIRTDRLELIPATRALLEAEIRGAESFRRELGRPVPPSWPPDLYDAPAVRFTLDRIGESPEARGWWLYYFASREESGTLVGAGGYKGPPGPDDSVEIGYSICREYRRRGYAREAAQGLVRHALGTGLVSRIFAQTLSGDRPSIGVLLRCNFRFLGPGDDPGTARYVLERAKLGPAAEDGKAGTR